MLLSGQRQHWLSEAEVTKSSTRLWSTRSGRQAVLVIIPDSTRTAPMPLLFRLFHDALWSRAALDFLVALGTHPPMDDAAGQSGWLPVRTNGPGHHGSSTTGGTRPRHLSRWSHLGARSGGAERRQLSVEVPVRFNHLGDRDGEYPYDQILVCGPVFPHEVVGFSGGNKYFLPGVAGPEMIN